jgi:hypothetical protein
MTVNNLRSHYIFLLFVNIKHEGITVLFTNDYHVFFFKIYLQDDVIHLKNKILQLGVQRGLILR